MSEYNVDADEFLNPYMVAIATEIVRERVKQNVKWGEQNHGPDRWFTILQEELGEAAKDALEGRPDEYREELVQSAAVIAAAIECHDRLMRGTLESSS